MKYHDFWWAGRGGQSISREEGGRFFASTLPDAVLGDVFSISFSEGYFPFVCWNDARLVLKGRYLKPGSVRGLSDTTERDKNKCPQQPRVQACKIYF